MILNHFRRSTFSLWFYIFSILQVECLLRCDRTPDGVTGPPTPADGKFILEISGNPETYVPGEQYTSKRKILMLLLVCLVKLKENLSNFQKPSNYLRFKGLNYLNICRSVQFINLSTCRNLK